MIEDKLIVQSKCFSPLEKTVSFYTRNDFAIINNLLVGDYEALWKWALIAYNDNRGIVDEYERGVRTIDSDYDIKWLNCLKERLISDLNDVAKRRIIEIAQNDIANIFKAMSPSKNEMHLYRTAWIDKNYETEGAYAYSREYKALKFEINSIIEIKTISSFCMTTYREEDDVGSDFYRYEIHIPQNSPVLELDQFVCHNEDGEVLLPPMKCKVLDMRKSENPMCRGIIKLQFIEALPEINNRQE